MKTTLQKVKDGIAAALLGKTPEQLADEQCQNAVKAAVDDYLIRHPDWKPSQQPVPLGGVSGESTNGDSPRCIRQKYKRIMKSLGAGAGMCTPHVGDKAALERARAKCRDIVSSDPDRYSHIIESTPLKRNE